LIVEFFVQPLRPMGFRLETECVRENGVIQYRAFWTLDGNPADTVPSAFASEMQAAKLKACLRLVSLSRRRDVTAMTTPTAGAWSSSSSSGVA
jgi:hypothetical protein